MTAPKKLLQTLCVAAMVAVAPSAQGKGGTPITACGQTVTTSAVLLQNLDCTESGVIVGAPGITIDLNGFTLRGDQAPGHYGIDDGVGHGGVTIKNGVLLNFDYGIFANGADDLTITKVVAAGNANDGIHVVGSGARITSSNASRNGIWGIDVTGSAVRIKSASAVGNAYSGIGVTGGAAQVVASSVSANANYGLYVAGADARVKSVTSGGDSVGFAVYGDGAIVQSVRALGNPNTGIIVSGTAIVIKSSVASGSTFAGISVTGASASIVSSTATGNIDVGISVAGEAAVLKGNRADGNGFFAGISDGHGLGISVQSSASPPAGTKNTAHGNDDPAECDPAALC